MITRPFDWRDISMLRRYRNQGVYLYSAQVLTRGSLLIPTAMLSSVAPGAGVFTSVCEQEDSNDGLLIGQALQTQGSPLAQMTFLAPRPALASKELLALIEYMVAQAAERGALRLLADVEEHSEAFTPLRKLGFSIYSRQRIWKFTSPLNGNSQSVSWRNATDQDIIPVRALYNNITPGLVQQSENFPSEYLRGMVCWKGDSLLGYAEFKYGRKGIWIQPLVHPDVRELPEMLSGLLVNITNRYSRPVYVCVRTYQSWLDAALEDLGAEPSPPQAVMVKHLAVTNKQTRPYAMPALEGGRPEISAPIAHSETHHN